MIKATGVQIYSSPEEDEFYYHTLSNGSWLQAYAKYPQVVADKSGALRYKVARFRSSVSKRLINALGQENGGIAAALLLGDKTELQPVFRTGLTISGGSHLFAVSGMHLSIWSGALFLILRKRAKVKMTPNIAASVFVLLYMVLTGLSPSVCRAGVMLILTFMARVIRRRSDPVNALCIAAVLLLCSNIYLAGNVSFLLSFFSTLGIVTIYPYFESRPKQGAGRLKRYAINTKNGIFLSFVAILASAPVAAFFFGAISLLSPVTTLLCTLPAETVMFTSFAALSLDFIPFVSKMLYFICGAGAKAIQTVVLFLSRYDFCLYPVTGEFLALWYGVTGAVMIFVYNAFGKKSRNVILCLLLSVTLLLTWQTGNYFWHINDVTIRVAAATNSTAVCIINENRMFSALIGTGESYDDGRRIKDYMRSKGVYKAP